jgi:hypothetical protein
MLLNYSKYLFLILVVLATACKSGKLQKKGVDLGKESSDSLKVSPSEFRVDETSFNQVRFKSDVDIATKSFSQKFPITIHVEKDKVIWASISIGLEIGRAKITQDSLIFMDRFNRKAYVGTWEELSKTSDFDLNFNILQSMLVGDMLFPIESNDKVVVESVISSVLQKRANLDFESKIDNTVYKLFEVIGTDPKSKSQLNLSFKSFVNENSRMTPSVISMLLSGRTEAKLDIKHSRIEFLDAGGLSFAFSVPTNYKIEKLPGL